MSPRIRRTASTALAALLALGFLAADLSAAKLLPVSLCVQEQTNWCWDATSQCVLKYYGTVVSQCAIAEWARTHATDYNFGSVNCCSDASQGCNHANYLWGGGSGMREILNNWGLSASVYSRQMYLSEINAQLDAYRPFVINWMWTSGGGHVLIGYGIDRTQLNYMDPWPGEGLKIASYDWVVASSDHSWSYALSINTSFNPTFYNLKVDATAGGTTNPVPGTYPCQKDSVVTISQTPQPYNQFINWTGDASGSSNTINVTMMADRSVRAVFAVIWAPVNLTGTKTLARGLAQGQYINVLRWEPNPGNVNIGNYQIYRNDGSGWSLVASLAATATNYWDRGVAKTATYSYLVVAVSSNGYSGYPAEVSVK
jgi:hypothetical protein